MIIGLLFSYTAQYEASTYSPNALKKGGLSDKTPILISKNQGKIISQEQGSSFISPVP